MKYKSSSLIKKTKINTEFNKINDTGEYFESTINIYSESPYIVLDNDEEYRTFKKNIQKSAKELCNSFDDEQVLLSLSNFENSEYYVRKDIHNILLRSGTYKFLIDLININPNFDFDYQYQQTDIQIEIQNEAFRIMLFLTSKYTELITKEFYDLNFIDLFFDNMKYYQSSELSLCRGLNIISNLLHDLPLFYDKAEFITRRYYSKIIKFIDDFYEFDEKSPELIKAEFHLIFAFSTSIPSSDQLNLARNQKRTTLKEAKEIYQIADEFAIKISDFLDNYDLIDSKEATYLFRSLNVVSDKFDGICMNLFENHLSPFFKILESENHKSIEMAIDFFRILYETCKKDDNNSQSDDTNGFQDDDQNQSNESEKEEKDDIKIHVLESFQWDPILNRLSEEYKWTLSFVEFIEESSSSFIFLWNNNVYLQLIENFDSFSYSVRSQICNIFIRLIEEISPDICIEYLVRNNVFSIFFTILENDDNIQLIGSILETLKIINSKAEIINQIDFVSSQYTYYDAINVFQDLPSQFSEILDEICECMNNQIK